MMKKQQKNEVKKNEMSRPTKLVLLAVFLLAVAFSISLFKYAQFAKENRYLVKNSSYSFSVKAPEGWVAEEKNIANASELVKECQGQALPAGHEIGRVRFKSYKYPEEFGLHGKFGSGQPSGAILDISINCVSENLKNQILSYTYGSLQVGGENAFAQTLQMPGDGRLKNISFVRGNLHFNINEYVYVSDEHKNKEGEEARIRKEFGEKFDKIISSFSFQ